MRILGWKDEKENFHTFCHFFAGVVTYVVFAKFWPVIMAGIVWELFDAYFGSQFGWLDRRGFSVGDVIWTILGGWFCIALLP